MTTVINRYKLIKEGRTLREQRESVEKDVWNFIRTIYLFLFRHVKGFPQLSENLGHQLCDKRKWKEYYETNEDKNLTEEQHQKILAALVLMTSQEKRYYIIAFNYYELFTIEDDLTFLYNITLAIIHELLHYYEKITGNKTPIHASAKPSKFEMELVSRFMQEHFGCLKSELSKYCWSHQ